MFLQGSVRNFHPQLLKTVEHEKIIFCQVKKFRRWVRLYYQKEQWFVLFCFAFEFIFHFYHKRFLKGFEITVNVSKKDLTYFVRNFKIGQFASENDPHVCEAKKHLYEKFKQFQISIDDVEYDFKSNQFYITFRNLAAVNGLLNSNLIRREKSGKIFHLIFLLGDDKVGFIWLWN